MTELCIAESLFRSPSVNTAQQFEFERSFISRKYNIRRNVNSDFSTVTMRRVAIIFFELGVVKNFMQKS